MYIRPITYKDFDGNERTEDFYFNLSEAEIMEMELSKDGGFDQWIKRIAGAQNLPELIKLFKSLILMSYGEKSLDGKSFIKKDFQTGRPLSEQFEQTAAYSVLFMELATNTEAATEFINKVIPENAAEAVEKAKADGSLDKVIPMSK